MVAASEGFLRGEIRGYRLLKCSLRRGAPVRMQASHVVPRLNERHASTSTLSLQLPLQCVDDAFWRRSSSLVWNFHVGYPPNITKRGHAQGRCSQTTRLLNSPRRDRELLFESLSARIKCDEAIRLKSTAFGGWWSNVHSFIKPLMHAQALGRPLISPPLPTWTDKKLCATRDMSCFFRPLSTCQGSTSSSGEFISLGSMANEHTRQPNNSWVTRLSRSYQSAHGTLHPRGWFWWVSNLVAYLVRPNRELQRELKAAINSTGLYDALLERQRTGRPILGLHVRHGDACGKDAQRSGRHCEPLSAYIAAAKRLTASFERGSRRVKTIYLATDSEEVVKQTKSYPEYTWIMFDEARTYSSRVNPHNLKWDLVLKRNREKAAGHHDGGKDEEAMAAENPNHRLASLTTLDVLLLSQADLFVGKFSSNFFRTAYELHSAECDCAAPFVSLDHAWCFDWGMQVGGSGNQTFSC